MQRGRGGREVGLFVQSCPSFVARDVCLLRVCLIVVVDYSAVHLSVCTSVCLFFVRAVVIVCLLLCAWSVCLCVCLNVLFVRSFVFLVGFVLSFLFPGV